MRQAGRDRAWRVRGLTVLAGLAVLGPVVLHSAPRKMSRQAVQKLADPIEARHRLPEGLLAAIAWVESRRDPENVGMRGANCVVGLGHILVYGCDAAERRRLLSPSGNLKEMSKHLVGSRRFCRKLKAKGGKTQCPCLWARYNWNGRTEWCRMVAAALDGPMS